MRNTILAILAVFLLHTANGQALSSRDDQLTEQWIEGYLYFMNTKLDELYSYERIHVSIHSEKSKKQKEITIKDPDLIKKIALTIREHIKETAIAEHSVTEDGTHVPIYKTDVFTSSLITIRWKREYDESIISIKTDETAHSILRKGPRNWYYLQSHTISSTTKLPETLKELL